ncbi:hypothetical protein CBL_21042 [Carabus blaptoides fortunei]
MKIEKKDKRRMRTMEKIKSYKLTELSVQKKYQEILKIKWSRTDKKIGIQEKWNRFKKIILEAAKESFGITKVRNNGRKKTDWWPENLKKNNKKEKRGMEEIFKYKKRGIQRKWERSKDGSKPSKARIIGKIWGKDDKKLQRKPETILWNTKTTKKDKRVQYVKYKRQTGTNNYTDEDEIMETLAVY